MLKYLDGPPEEPESEGETRPATQTEAAEDNWLAELDNQTLLTEEGTLPELEPAISPDIEENQASTLKQKITGLEHRIGYLERIVKVSQILNSTLSLGPLLQIIVQSATELTDTEECSIMLFDKNTQELHFAEATGGATEAMKKVSVPLDGSIGGWVVRSNRPLLIRDAKNDPRFYPGVDDATDFETRSILGVPLRVRDKVIGVLEVVNKRSEEGFSQDDIQITETLGAHAAIAIENARLMDELQQAYRDLSEIDRIKGDFVSIASHELRTPLSVILGYASFLKENVTGQASEQADIVLNSAMRLRALIDDMVNLRHIQTDEVPLERSIFSLRQLVLDVVKEFADFVQAKEQILTTRFAPDDLLLNIDADRQKLYLVLANLISNANKFTGPGGRIHINVELKKHEYWINVIDTGVGIPETEYNRIFDQFYQVEPALTRKYEGMGLGLSIVKGMVEVHKGRIWVESVVGKGSNFSVVFPTAPDVAN
ncbi:MAG: GAF domain-containing sensor histidine kinase [Anaerolineae bacterium]|nr:GAF domain-containing sensor histidine kinase [Anaerolineae bacterium]